IEMIQPGIEVRPLKEMTGHAMFNEVFLTDAVVPDANRIGDVNNGWAATNTTLLHERSGMGARGGGGAPVGRMARAGSVVGDLDKRAGDFAPPRRSVTADKAKADKEPRRPSSPAQSHIELARQFGKLDDPVVRQGIVQAHILGTISRLTTERHKAVRSQGGDIPGVANFSKLLMADIVRLNRDLGMQILGARGMLHDYDDANRGEMAKLPGGPLAVAATSQALGAQALPIYGGTDQIQKNIVGERTLGLPKEPGALSKLPFNELPKNGCAPRVPRPRCRGIAFCTCRCSFFSASTPRGRDGRGRKAVGSGGTGPGARHDGRGDAVVARLRGDRRADLCGG